MIKIFNTFSRKKELFKPKNNNIVNMYVCGVTVYDMCHIGHARTFIVFDLIYRYLKYCGYKLNYVRNITDVDDKIIKKAKKNNESIETLTNRMIEKMKKDFLKLNILLPNLEPRVTHHIQEIIDMIKTLILLKFAYISSNGDVMFEIKKFKDYGKLSLKNIKNLKIKKEMDFTLWKITKFNEPSWLSPWGKGRPGWHIECSAMSYKYLGNHIDIHGGGSDLIFPHHENEIAQSFCSYTQNVKYWMHAGLIITNSKKMSKSLDNFFTINDICNFFNPEILRYFLMSSHYRSSLTFNKEQLNISRLSLESLYNSIKDTDITFLPTDSKKNIEFEIKFQNAMNDDFNIPVVYAIFFDMMHEVNRLKLKNINKANDLASKLRQLAQIIGLLTQNPEMFLKNNITDIKKIKKINLLIQMRNKARKTKNWSQADDIRNKLKEIDVILEDNINETFWKSK